MKFRKSYRYILPVMFGVLFLVAGSGAFARGPYIMIIDNHSHYRLLVTNCVNRGHMHKCSLFENLVIDSGGTKSMRYYSSSVRHNPHFSFNVNFIDPAKGYIDVVKVKSDADNYPAITSTKDMIDYFVQRDHYNLTVRVSFIDKHI